MRLARFAARASLLVLALTFGVIAGGCSDESSKRSDRNERDVPFATQRSEAWIGLADDVLPEEWLVRRATSEKRQIDPRDVEKARVLLDAASRRFGDQTRMIANRAAQLETMLSQKDMDEDAVALIVNLTRVAEGGEEIGGFASLCQYYFNLRVQGVGREQALAKLAKRYGSGG